MDIGSGRVALDISHLGVSFPRKKQLLSRSRFWALEDVSFSLLHGETLGVIGRNGVGKSTLLRVCAQMILPDRGSVINHGCTVSLLSLQAGFIPHLSGRENAILSGMLMGMSKANVERSLQDIIGFSGLGEFINEPVNVYSTGMRARLGFAVAYHADPDVLLVDEIIGVGDAEFKRKSSAVMRERIQSDKTVVLVSHNVKMIEELCNRVLWIEEGVVRKIGETHCVLPEFVKAA